MPPRRLTSGVVYRRGSHTQRQLTPRPTDLLAEPGTAPGLSTNATLETGAKGQQIDLARLPAELGAFADDPGEGGTAGHVAIAPVDAAGNLDAQRLAEWAAARDAETEHPLTTLLMQAIVQKNVVGTS